MTHFSPLPPLNTTFTEGPQPRIASQPPADIGGIVTSKRSKSIPEKASFTASCSQADSGDPAPQVAPIGALGNSARHQTRAASAPSSRHRALGRGVCSRRPPPGLARVSDLSQGGSLRKGPAAPSSAVDHDRSASVRRGRARRDTRVDASPSRKTTPSRPARRPLPFPLLYACTAHHADALPSSGAPAPSPRPYCERRLRDPPSLRGRERRSEQHRLTHEHRAASPTKQVQKVVIAKSDVIAWAPAGARNTVTHQRAWRDAPTTTHPPVDLG